MIIGGLQKTSLIDFPGKVSCVCFVSGCNFRCPYCHNPDLVDLPAKPFIDESSFLALIRERQGFLDGVVISGGEPTLQKDLPAFVSRIKREGYAVKLDTNGSHPKMIRELLEKRLLDYIAMDVKTDPSLYPLYMQREIDPSDICSSIKLIMASGIPYEFRTTCVRPIVSEETVQSIGRLIQGSFLYVLQQFNRTRVLQPDFFERGKAGYDQEEMMHLKSIAEPWVEKCI
ncbi:MAG TPA: anaerobic ribonucleoside-triphosphate reductase activating protein, partial [Desulfatiglandales bacterium]|nr:anaerobic ribonucleoside-triphosphate reductase activating protein [Desulfatiglandales bacterium]